MEQAQESVWHKIRYRGIAPGMPHMQRKQMELSNRISMVLVPLQLVNIVLFAWLGMPVSFQIAVVSFGVALLAWLVMGYGWVTAAKLIHVLGMCSLMFFVFNVPVIRYATVLAFSALAFVMPILPLLLLDHKREKTALYGVLIYDTLVFLAVDPLIFAMAPDIHPDQIGGPANSYYTFYKVVLVGGYVLMVLGFLFLKRVNAKAETALQASQDRLTVQNEELRETYEALQTHADDLKAHRMEITLKSQRLQEQQEEIAVQNEELQANQEELKIQNEQLEHTLTQLRNTQSQLIQAEKMGALGQLTAGIAHELNNPINAVQSGMEGLRSAMDKFMALLDMYDGLDNTQAHPEWEAIEAYKKRMRYAKVVGLLRTMPDTIAIGAQRAAHIVKELRTFSRLDESDLKQANVQQGLESTLVLLKNQYLDQVVITQHFMEGMPLAECYPGRLNQVFLNVIANAIQAVKERASPLPQVEFQPEVTITTYTEGVDAVVVVADNGNGIPQHLQQRIFEPFYTTKPVGKGTGLGLGVSASIMADHAGTLTVDSEMGRGSTFTIRWPLRQA